MEKKSFSMEVIEMARVECMIIIIAKVSVDLAQSIDESMIRNHGIICSEVA